MGRGTAIACIAALGVAGFIFAAASNQEAPDSFEIPTGDKAVMTDGTMGCRQMPHFDQLVRLAGRDHDAFNTYAASHCRFLAKGRAIVVEEKSVWHGAICARPVGEPDCLWTPTTAIGRGA